MPKADEKSESTNLQIEEMRKYGITHVPVDYFHFGRYRYTSLDAAVAEAKREVQENPKLASGTG